MLFGYVSDGSPTGNHLWWQKVAGAYRFRPKSGWWAYWRDGLILSRTTNIEDPLFKLPANLLIVVSGVAKRFAEKLFSGEKLSGSGRHYATDEEIIWEMRLPIARIKK